MKGCLTPEHINDRTLLRGLFGHCEIRFSEIVSKKEFVIKNEWLFYLRSYVVVREILSIPTNMKVFFFAAAVHATPTHMQVYAGWLYHWN